MTAMSISPPGAREQNATRIALFTAGAAIAAWAPLVPFVKAGTGLGPAGLGLLLLCLGMGSIIAMPLSGAMAQRFGCRIVITAGSAAFILMLPVLATVPPVFVLAPALFVFGAGIGAVDCVANIQAIIVERASGRTMMSGFHALYSLGGLLGAGVVTGMLAIGMPPFTSILLANTAILALAVYACAGHLTYGTDSHGEDAGTFGMPRGIVLVLGVLAFTFFLTEGAALDWSAVFLSTVRGIDPNLAGLGFVCFSLVMTLGRFTGDRAVDAFGSTNIVLAGGLLAAAGMALVVLEGHWLVAVLGYAILGAGCSNVAPVLFSAAGRQTTMPEAVAVPVITTLGYAGILAGPGLVGFVAQATSLPVAFAGLALLLIAVSLIGKLAKV